MKNRKHSEPKLLTLGMSSPFGLLATAPPNPATKNLWFVLVGPSYETRNVETYSSSLKRSQQSTHKMTRRVQYESSTADRAVTE